MKFSTEHSIIILFQNLKLKDLTDRGQKCLTMIACFEISKEVCLLSNNTETIQTTQDRENETNLLKLKYSLNKTYCIVHCIFLRGYNFKMDPLSLILKYLILFSFRSVIFQCLCQSATADGNDQGPPTLTNNKYCFFCSLGSYLN